MIEHPFPPVFSPTSKKLILGSFPSVASRGVGFYYGNPHNRFYRVLTGVFSDELPETNEEKSSYILSHSLALWDVVASCSLTGSADSSIKNAVPNDVPSLVGGIGIEKIFINGKTAAKIFDKFFFDKISVPVTVLPSTSPANAAFSLEKLIENWRIIAL